MSYTNKLTESFIWIFFHETKSNGKKALVKGYYLIKNSGSLNTLVEICAQKRRAGRISNGSVRL